MLHNRVLLVVLGAMCAMGPALAGQPEEPDQARIEDFFPGEPGQVEQDTLHQCAEFASHVRDHKPLDENILDLGTELAAKLADLSGNGSNLKATLLLRTVHYWRSIAFMRSNLLVEASLELILFKLMCQRYPQHCAPELPRKAFDELNKAWTRTGLAGILGLRRFQGSTPASEVKRKAREALMRYRDMLSAGPEDAEGDLGATIGELAEELLQKVERAYRAVDSLIK